MENYSNYEKFRYYGSRFTNKNLSINQRKYAKERYQNLKDSIVSNHFPKFPLKSMETGTGTIMTIASVISAIRFKKDLNVKGMAEQVKPSLRRIKKSELYNEDLNRLDSFMIKNKLNSNEKLYFKN